MCGVQAEAFLMSGSVNSKNILVSGEIVGAEDACGSVLVFFMKLFFVCLGLFSLFIVSSLSMHAYMF